MVTEKPTEYWAVRGVDHHYHDKVGRRFMEVFESLQEAVSNRDELTDYPKRYTDVELVSFQVKVHPCQHCIKAFKCKDASDSISACSKSDIIGSKPPCLGCTKTNENCPVRRHTHEHHQNKVCPHRQTE